jgi:hypothetical protein
MDMDEEDLLKMANPSNSPKTNLAPPTKQSQIPGVISSRFFQGKASKKDLLGEDLGQGIPRCGRRISHKDAQEPSFGEIFAISSGVTDCFKKRISNKRVQVEENISTHSGALKEDSKTHYSCPLGYISLTFKGHEYQALLDTGSIANLIPLGLLNT